MKLELTINGGEEPHRNPSPAPECRFRLGEGAELRRKWRWRSRGSIRFCSTAAATRPAWRKPPTGLVVTIEGYRFEIEVRDPRRWRERRAAAGTAGVQTIAAPMPGKVVRVLVAAGETVEAGQGLVVVEAMKMQNEMKALRAGKVLSLPAREGATVAAGEVLAGDANRVNDIPAKLTTLCSSMFHCS